MPKDDKKATPGSRPSDCTSTLNCTRVRRLSARNPQAEIQLVDQQSAAGLVRLKPFAIDDQLRHGALAHVLNYLGGCGGIGVDVDLGEGHAVRGQEFFRRAAVSAPG